MQTRHPTYALYSSTDTKVGPSESLDMLNSFCGNMHVLRWLLCQFYKHQYCIYLYHTALCLNVLHAPHRHHFRALLISQGNLSLMHNIPFLSPLTHALH